MKFDTSQQNKCNNIVFCFIRITKVPKNQFLGVVVGLPKNVNGFKFSPDDSDHFAKKCFNITQEFIYLKHTHIHSLIYII